MVSPLSAGSCPSIDGEFCVVDLTSAGTLVTWTKSLAYSSMIMTLRGELPHERSSFASSLIRSQMSGETIGKGIKSTDRCSCGWLDAICLVQVNRPLFCSILAQSTGKQHVPSTSSYVPFSPLRFGGNVERVLVPSTFFCTSSQRPSSFCSHCFPNL